MNGCYVYSGIVSFFRQAVQGILVPRFTKNFAEQHSFEKISVVEFIFRKAGEVFNFTKDKTLPLGTSRHLENLHNMYFLYTCRKLLLSTLE